MNEAKKKHKKKPWSTGRSQPWGRSITSQLHWLPVAANRERHHLAASPPPRRGNSREKKIATRPQRWKCSLRNFSRAGSLPAGPATLQSVACSTAFPPRVSTVCSLSSFHILFRSYHLFPIIRRWGRCHCFLHDQMGKVKLREVKSLAPQDTQPGNRGRSPESNPLRGQLQGPDGDSSNWNSQVKKSRG